MSIVDSNSRSSLSPASILETGFGFFRSKVLLSAVRLDLFTLLSGQALTGPEIQSKLGLHHRATFDFLDALVSLKFLQRDGSGIEARYRNTAETDHFLDKSKESYMGGCLEMANDRLYRFWSDLDLALKTGQAQNETKHGSKRFFEEVYSDPSRLEQFLVAMRGFSAANSSHLAQKFDFSKYKTLCDVGGATGVLCCRVAERHAHLQCQSFDLPVTAAIAKKYIDQDGMSSRVTVISGDFMIDPLPKADVITMGMILHDWNLDNKMKLIRAAYDALPQGGAFIVVEHLIDDDRKENSFGLLMSLNMLIEFGDAFDYTFADFKGWCQQVGFNKFELIHLAGACSAAVAYK